MITPQLDKNFYPMIKALNDYESRVNGEKKENVTTITLVVERNGGYNYVYSYKALVDGVDDEHGKEKIQRKAQPRGERQ